MIIIYGVTDRNKGNIAYRIHSDLVTWPMLDFFTLEFQVYHCCQNNTQNRQQNPQISVFYEENDDYDYILTKDFQLSLNIMEFNIPELSASFPLLSGPLIGKKKNFYCFIEI